MVRLALITLRHRDTETQRNHSSRKTSGSPRSSNGTQPERGKAGSPAGQPSWGAKPAFPTLRFSFLNHPLRLCDSVAIYGYSSCLAISGFGFLSADRYVVRGFVFNSANNE